MARTLPFVSHTISPLSSAGSAIFSGRLELCTRPVLKNRALQRQAEGGRRAEAGKRGRRAGAGEGRWGMEMGGCRCEAGGVLPCPRAATSHSAAQHSSAQHSTAPFPCATHFSGTTQPSRSTRPARSPAASPIARAMGVSSTRTPCLSSSSRSCTWGRGSGAELSQRCLLATAAAAAATVAATTAAAAAVAAATTNITAAAASATHPLPGLQRLSIGEQSDVPAPQQHLQPFQGRAGQGRAGQGSRWHGRHGLRC